MRAGLRLVLTAVLALGFAGCSDSTDPGDERPRVEAIGVTAAPTAPAGSLAQCYTAADGLTVSATCPVIKWKGLTYWVFAFEDERNALLLVAFDNDQNLIFQSERPGTRQLYQITVNDNAQVVTLFGLGSLTVNIPWSALEPENQG